MAFVSSEVEEFSAPRPCTCVVVVCAVDILRAYLAPSSQQSRRQFRHFSPFFTVTAVAVVNIDEIAYDSPCARVYREGRYSRLAGFVIYVTDAAIAGDVRLKNNNNSSSSM